VLVVALATLLFIGSQCVGTGGTGRAQEIPAAAASVPGYLRPGAATYLALPRWYVVESAEEYAAFLDGGAPSGFPHLGALRQYWRHYRGVCATTRNRYPFDADVHFTLGVAGVGFSAEHVAKGAYEATVGRLSEWLGGHDSAEDAFARRVAREYGQFLRGAPWYGFPFAERLEALWTETPLWGPRPLRKWERRLVLSAEYGVKAVYGWLAGWAARAGAGGDDSHIHLWAELVPPRAFADPRIERVQEVARGAFILRVPRGPAFTEIVAALARHGARFREIAGNDEILVTARMRGDIEVEGGWVVLAEAILTAPETRRIAVAVPVRSLHTVLTGFARRGAVLERVYDY